MVAKIKTNAWTLTSVCLLRVPRIKKKTHPSASHTHKKNMVKNPISFSLYQSCRYLCIELKIYFLKRIPLYMLSVKSYITFNYTIFSFNVLLQHHKQITFISRFLRLNNIKNWYIILYVSHYYCIGSYYILYHQLCTISYLICYSHLYYVCSCLA